MKTSNKRQSYLRRGTWRHWLILMISALMILSTLSPAFAHESVCAEVKIVIEQKLSFERQAFDAKMVIRNGLTDSAVKNVKIDLLFLDSNSQPVVATQETNATDALFFYRTDSLQGIDGVEGSGNVQPKTSAEIHWLIIPSAGAADAAGALYYVGAKVTYTINGIEQTIEVTPDYVIVKPQPMLALDYFLPVDVYADDPFTEEIEIPEPFTLGVRIHNKGYGSAMKTSIESAQPRIVENKQKLLIDFKILGGYVSDQPAGKSLLLDFGTIEPGTSKMGRWNMVTTLSGKFVEFNANYSHADNLGGAVTSLIEDVKTHTLVHDVKVDLTGRDNIRDFLARDGDTLRVYESDSIDTEVTDTSDKAQLTTGAGKAEMKIQPVAGFIYSQVNDPYQGKNLIAGVTRSDGKVLPIENTWLSKTRNKDLTWSYAINLFDVNSTGEYTLTFTKQTQSSITGIVFDDANNNGLLDEGEQGIGAAAVDLSGRDEQGISILVTGYTAVDGKFTFNGLAPGRYTLKVQPLDGTVNSATVAGSAGGEIALGEISDISIGTGISASGYQFGKKSEIALEHGALEGIVFHDINADGVIDEGEPGIEAATVILSGINSSGRDVSKALITDAKGRFAFGNLSAGVYQLQVTPVEGMRDISSRVGSAGGKADIGKVVEINLATAQQASGYWFAKKLDKQSMGYISGMVKNADEDNLCLGSVMITLSGTDEMGRKLSRTTQSDRCGYYAFSEIPAGTYTLQVGTVAGMVDTQAQAGSAGGVPQPGAISDIMLTAGDAGCEYNFWKKTNLNTKRKSTTNTAPEMPQSAHAAIVNESSNQSEGK